MQPLTSQIRAPPRHVLRFEVSAETQALFRKASLQPGRRRSCCFGDDAVPLEMARCVLRDPVLEALCSEDNPAPCTTDTGRDDEGRVTARWLSASVRSATARHQPADGALVRFRDRDPGAARRAAPAGTRGKPSAPEASCQRRTSL
jgi:hypothetical protein